MPNKQQRPDQTKSTEKSPGRLHRSAETVPPDALAVLQSTLGNATLRRLLGVRQQAASETPTPVEPATQIAIDAQRGNGRELEGGLQEPLAQAASDGPGGVRLHRNPESDLLARSLSANAFTQGRDVFLRTDRDARTPRRAQGHGPGALRAALREGQGPVGVLHQPRRVLQHYGGLPSPKHRV